MNLSELSKRVSCELYFDDVHRILYSTDASDYSERALGVAYPRNREDIRQILQFCHQNSIPVIPRGGGTSLAGQVVGNGLVVDVSRYMTKIIEINKDERYCWVEPGVIPDILNMELQKYGLFWGPETSTSNRNTIGGMVGNNSCGTHFPVYGNTREHLLELIGFLSDGSEVHFRPVNKNSLESLGDKEKEIITKLVRLLDDKNLQHKIAEVYPKPSIRRRNNGYAVDYLMDTDLLQNNGKDFNLCHLIAGSEGTLMFATEIKLNLVDLPPKFVGVVAAHFSTLYDALQANIIAIENGATASELIDQTIISLTKENPTQSRNRFFISGEPEAILIIEYSSNNENSLDEKLNNIIGLLKQNNLGYHFPIIKGKEISRIWELRKAGLGLLSNITSDNRSVTVIEDTAVDIHDLPQYTKELIDRMNQMGVKIITYAHAGSGELHFHPILNLKTQRGVELYREVLVETAKIVKKYRGSLSGEHGDGRLRSELIPFMYGNEIYQLFKQIKSIFDPKGILNPGKIIDAPPMNTHLRIDYRTQLPKFQTYFDYNRDNGFHHAIERCNGSGDCRRPNAFAGVMCPSYRATLNEKHSTRARANVLREILINSSKANPLASGEIKEVMELCLSCKACKSECPSNVDITKYKAEFLQHYYDEFGTPFKTFLVGYLPKINKILSKVPNISNYFFNIKLFKSILFNILNFHPNRNIPKFSSQTLVGWYRKEYKPARTNKIVYLFADEFTNYNESEIGIKAIKLLDYFGYQVIIPKHLESGRTYLSKGLLKKAKKIAELNTTYLTKLISDNTPLIGIEPSAILTFRDEYPELVSDEFKNLARQLAKNCLLFDEFFNKYIKLNSTITEETNQTIHLHTHCYQKALAREDSLINFLEQATNCKVIPIQSTCCGMAGAFGYEKDKYDISLAIAKLSLVPYIQKLNKNEIIIANGTSCRHQIWELTGRKALHPIEFVYDIVFDKSKEQRFSSQ